MFITAYFTGFFFSVPCDYLGKNTFCKNADHKSKISHKSEPSEVQTFLTN